MFTNTIEKNRANEIDMEKHESQVKVIFRRFCRNKLAVVGLVIFVIILLASIFAPLITKYGYEEMDMSNIYATPSLKHLCGTDQLGRDILSRLLFGGRYTLALGFSAQLFTLIFGVILGSIVGFFGGRVDLLVMRLLDIFESIPGVLLAIIICTVLGTGFNNTVIAMGVGGIPMVCRLLRASILTVRDQEYLEAASSINCSKFRQIRKHLLPNAISPLIVTFTMGLGATIMTAAGISYLGLGVQPPTPEWGAMLSDTRKYFQYYPHMALFPGIAIAITVLVMNLIGDGLRDALDPKLKD
jgi:peptide/nickel transport system permease protein